MKKCQILKPDYYDRFACKGPSCRNTCCQEWSVYVSKDEVRRMKQLLQGNSAITDINIFKKLPPDRRTKNAEFQLVFSEDGKCPLLSVEGLCQLHCDYGADALPKVCRTFPRKVYGYGETRFYALALGCEKVLEDLLERREKITIFSSTDFLDNDVDTEKIVSNNANGKEMQGFYFNILNFCMALLQAEDATFEDRLILLGIGLKRVEQLIAEGEYSKVQGYCDDYLRSLESIEDISAIIPEYTTGSAAMLSNFLTPVWMRLRTSNIAADMLSAVEETLQVSADIKEDCARVSYSVETYEKLQKEYEAFMRDKNNFIENIMIAFAYFYRFPCHEERIAIWENYMFFVWLSSYIKFMLTACMPLIHSEEDLIDCLVSIFRTWGHSEDGPKVILKYLHENFCDDLAHLALLLKSC